MQKNNNSIAHLARLQTLLQIEYQEEKNAYENETKISGIERKLRQGRCWYPLTLGRTYYNALNQYVVEVNRSSSDDTEHEFEPGRSVTFFKTNGQDEPTFLPIIGQVSFVEGSRMLVVVSNAQAVDLLKDADRIGVQIYFDETSYRAMFDALNAISKTENKKQIRLRNVICGDLKPMFRENYPTRLPWLNASQEKAVNQVLSAKDVAVVHGPPGTGKTTTLVESIYETLHREAQVMVCAQSNTAVDWICEKLIERGVSVLRVGNPLRISDRMLSHTYERRFESHPDYSELWAIRKAIRDIQKKGRKEQTQATRDHLHKLKNRATELEISIDSALFAEARVVASTLIGASNRVLSYKQFTTLFIDEAAQALQPACWVAMLKADRVIFAGDHCQLPPTVKSAKAMREGLSRTILEDVVVKYPESVTLLNTQYRMNEAIMSFSSDWFYNGELKAAKEIAGRTISFLDHPIEWYDTKLMEYKESQNSNTLSRINKDEARELIRILESYVDQIGIARILEESIDFAIISPYKAQVYYLRSLVKRSHSLRKIRKAISVNSVDGFQGQERDVVFVSLVRGNDESKIGFLSDLRRMNVAITRARMKLVILGDAGTLTSHKFYRKLYEHISLVGKVHCLEPVEELLNMDIEV